MSTILFIFAILSTPKDRYVCDLWTKNITRDAVIVSCGIDLLEGLRVDVYTLDMDFICARDAAYLNAVDALMQECGMNKTLDNYIIRIIEPGYTSLICYVESQSDKNPTSEEVTTQCPQVQAGKYISQFAGEKQITEKNDFTCPPRVIDTGFGIYDQPPSAESLLTADDLTWLAGKLILSGIVKTECLSPLNEKNMTATPCGMAAARQQVIQWQNQFDAEIYYAALAYSVPAKLLKRIMIIESQLWPFYTAPNEYGVMQITDNGLDTLMRFDGADIDPYYFDRGETGRLWSRSVTRDALACVNCTLTEAVQKIKNDMPLFSRLLASFHCRAVTINPSLSGADAWRQTVIDYNGDPNYLLKVEN